MGETERYLAVGAVLFVLGALGFLTRRNLIMVFLSAEMMLHGVSLTLVTFGRLHGTLEGQAFTIFVLTVAGCEAGLALALILALFHQSKSLDIDLWASLREPDLSGPEIERSTTPVLHEEGLPRLSPAGRAPRIADPDAIPPVPTPTETANLGSRPLSTTSK